MKRIVIAISLLFAQGSFAADKDVMKMKMNMKEKDSFTLIHTAELSKMLDLKSPNLYVYDANTNETRKKEGVIPGAKILDSYDKYDVAKVLPANKDAKLVFYCANTQCSASHSAANRAFQAGYKDINVMADGIQGWKKAGKASSAISTL